MIEPVATHSTVLISLGGRTQLTVELMTSSGTGMIGFRLSHPTVRETSATAWLYAVDFAAALASLGLSIKGDAGATLADRCSWDRRRGVNLGDDGAFTVESRTAPNPVFAVRAPVAPPVVGWSPMGNPTVTPVNDRVLLEIRIDGDGPAIVDPLELLAVLTDHGIVRSYEDWDGVLTRHLREPEPAVEVLPNGRTIRFGSV